MQPGDDFIYQCPNCGNYLKRGSLVSGNTIRSIFYSDGKTISPMLPQFPNLTKCKQCDTILWLNKLKEVGKVGWNIPQNPLWINAKRVKFLNIDDYFIALNTGIAENKEELLFIRLNIWWAYNDRVRQDSNLFINENDELIWKENCLELIQLLDHTNIDHKLLIAEIYRNFGDFKTCMDIMKSIELDDAEWIKDLIIAACEEQNKLLIELKYDRSKYKNNTPSEPDPNEVGY